MKRRYHLHFPALLYCGLVLLVGTAAMNTQNNLLFWIFGLMFSGLVISGVVSGVMMLGIRIKRIDPEHVAVGEPLIVQYRVVNRNGFVPIFNIHIEELPVASADGAGVGWQDVMAASNAWVMHVGPQETVHGEAMFRPRRRGEVRFGRIRVWTTFPFGLVKKSITIEQPQLARILPRLYRLRPGLLRSIETPGPVGTRITMRPGGADDYFGLREYRELESIRHIAWKRSAGVDQLLCIERSMPSPPRLRIALDLSTPTENLRVEAADKWSARDLEERAISLAASLIHQANFEGFEVGLTVLGAPCAAPGVDGEDAEAHPGDFFSLDTHFAVRRNHWHARKLLACLATIDLDRPRSTPNFGLLSNTERAGLIVVRPDRAQPNAERSDVVDFTGRQLERLTTGPLGWTPPPESSELRISTNTSRMEPRLQERVA